MADQTTAVDTLRDEWLAYDRELASIGMSAAQRETCHRAFYAGAGSCFQLVMEATEITDDTEVERRLHAIHEGILTVVGF